ncbi:MAG: glycosyltransferase [Chloroflexi bacterium AL-W]|nr:glycosyltransferase [Chloroflexi bacterium AL-N1]NOK64540.1 glycosyltransferase [Chloroflexi bacterium AL-N10]NOK75782.1 glycosyltransferase [Chloroflexi bacterium AL-N5]NOK80459.1 glycosyltransferase [Chloroflexi bacterium AL-W]NOK86973.1 glycosyltransferase [Chloroflexi bacterium AL-N15]
MRIYQLLRGLTAHHDVTCLTFVPDKQAEHALQPLHDICRVIGVTGPPPRTLLQRAWTTCTSKQPDMALRNASTAYAHTLRNLLTTRHFDIVQAESIEMADYLFVANQTSQKHHAGSKKTERSRLILDQFNAEFMLQQRAFLTDIKQAHRWHAAGYSFVQWHKLWQYERQLLQQCDAVMAVSDEDRHTLQKLWPQATIQVVPNGVDTSHFHRQALLQEHAGWFSLGPPTLVFSGTLDFRPNIDALVWFTREVLPHIRKTIPHIQLLIVGKRPAPVVQQLATDSAIHLVGSVSDTRPYIAGAAIYIVPMRIGGGVRLKLLEALSLETPVVSTHMGAEGVTGLHHGEHCWLADEPPQFAQTVLHVLEDSTLGQQVGAAGRTLVRSHYDWSVIIPKLEMLYTSMIR